MKIGIDAFGCNHGRSGIGSYIFSLVKNIPKTKHEFQLFGPELDKYTYTSDIDYIDFEGVDIADTEFAEKFWHFKSLNSFIKKQKYDALIYPAGTALLPPVFSVPSVPIVQNLLSEDKNLFTQFGIKRLLKSASGIISPSQFIKNDLIALGIPESNIRVIYNGIDEGLFKPADNDSGETVLIQPFAIRRPYIIYASRLSGLKKHHIELIKAFSIFKRKNGTAHRLVIAGAGGDTAEAVHKAVIESGFSSDILLTGHFPHENLPQLYAAADLCVFPSAAEGVGLPVIEAMACGIPAACAEAGALPEIAGEAAVYFNPKDPEDIAGKIAKLINTADNSTYRTEIIQKGLKWIEQYNWKTTAEQTVEYLSSIL